MSMQCPGHKVDIFPKSTNRVGFTSITIDLENQLWHLHERTWDTADTYQNGCFRVQISGVAVDEVNQTRIFDEFGVGNRAFDRHGWPVNLHVVFSLALLLFNRAHCQSLVSALAYNTFDNANTKAI